MPKPLLIARDSGLYVRFRVPTDLQKVVGSRFIVRPIRYRGDAARLASAYLGMVLSRAFDSLRGGGTVDIKKAMEVAKVHIDLTLEAVELPNGVVLRGVRVETPDDERQLQDIITSAGASPNVSIAQVQAKIKPRKEDQLAHLMEVHLSDLRRASRDSKTILESRHTLSLFLGVVGNKAVTDIDGTDCRLFFDEVRFWPKHATQRPEFKRLSIKAVLAKAKSLNEPAPAQATLNKHRQRLSVFFNWLIKNKHMQANPLAGVLSHKKDDAEEETGRAFTQQELDAIFEPSAFKAWADRPHRWWVPMLGLYSGARVNELSQLYVADVETVNGIPGYHINKRFPGQKLKNKASKRFVPLAQPLLDAGFLDFVSDVKAAGHDRLFPHLPNNDGRGFGKQMSKQFCAYIKARDVLEEGMGMHAFRHTLATRLDRAGVTENSIGKITGHKGAGATLPKFYIDTPTLEERVLALSKFQAGVSLSTYQSGQFSASLKV